MTEEARPCHVPILYKIHILATTLFHRMANQTPRAPRTTLDIEFLILVLILTHSNPCSNHQGWSDCVSFGDFQSYRERFQRIQTYFSPRFPEAAKLGNEMIKTILDKTTATSSGDA